MHGRENNIESNIEKIDEKADESLNILRDIEKSINKIQDSVEKLQGKGDGEVAEALKLNINEKEDLKQQEQHNIQNLISELNSILKQITDVEDQNIASEQQLCSLEAIGEDVGSAKSILAEREKWVEENKTKVIDLLQKLGAGVLNFANNFLPSMGSNRKFLYSTNQDDVNVEQQWALDKNICNKADYTGIDRRVAQEWNKGIYDNMKDFPELRDNIRFIGSTQARNEAIRAQLMQEYWDSYRMSNPDISDDDLCPYVNESVNSIMDNLSIGDSTIAQSLTASDHQYPLISEYNGITVNIKYGGNYDYFTKIKKEDVMDMYKPVGCDNVKATVDHEMGHQIDSMFSVRSDPEMIKLYNSISNTPNGKNQLSEYGMTKIGEFIAEGWSEFRNNPQPRQVSRKIADIIYRRYETWKKKK